MHHLTLATTTLLPLALALTLPSPLHPRSCPTAYPASLGFPINYAISQSAGGGNKHDAHVSFSVPAGAYGCTLRADFPAGYAIASSGDAQVDVFDGSDRRVGTVTFASPQSAVINSFVCAPRLEYRLSIASSDQAGSVAFAEVQGAGLSMTYNC